MTYQIVRAMVEAHVNRNDSWFKSLVNQFAAKQRDEKKRVALLNPLRKLDDLPADVAALIRETQPVSTDDLVLPTGVRHQLNEIGRELRNREVLTERGLRPRSRLLFHGPPGNGKTSCAAAIAGGLGLRAFTVEMSSVISSYIGETGKLLAKALRVLDAGHTLVLDEIDAVAASRTSSNSSASREYNTMVAALLGALDRPMGGVLVATTNRLDIIDPAIVRRFDAVVEFPAPTVEQMESLARKLGAKFGVPPMEVSVATCRNFDDVEKTVRRVACRRVLDEVERRAPMIVESNQ